MKNGYINTLPPFQSSLPLSLSPLPLSSIVLAKYNTEKHKILRMFSARIDLKGGGFCKINLKKIDRNK
jgi:hypothetical protein